jgi:hypothetical protein
MALVTGLSDQAMHRVVNKLVSMVCDDGSLEAAKFLFSFVVGPPLLHSTDPDDLDNAELQKLRLEGQRDALDNNNLSVPAALALEKAQRLAASVEVLGLELADPDSDVARHLLATLRDAGLARLAEAAKEYAGRLAVVKAAGPDQIEQEIEEVLRQAAAPHPPASGPAQPRCGLRELPPSELPETSGDEQGRTD